MLQCSCLFVCTLSFKGALVILLLCCCSVVVVLLLCCCWVVVVVLCWYYVVALLLLFFYRVSYRQTDRQTGPLLEVLSDLKIVHLEHRIAEQVT